MRPFFAAAGLVTVLLATQAAGQQPPVFTPFGALPVLDAYLESLRQQLAIPGMSAAVVRDGAVVWESGYGFQDVSGRIRATPDTPYPIGDMSGPLAAVMLLECVERRQLELEQPLRQYAAELPEGDATLRDLLSHTSAAPEAPFVFAPGRYAQLTRVVERCASEPYLKSVAKLLDRTAMRDSVPGSEPWNSDALLQDGQFDAADVDRYRRVLARMAAPYKIDRRGRAERLDLPPFGVNASTGLVTTVRDLARLDAALDSGVILRQETLDAAWNPVVSRGGVIVPMGLGWFVQRHRDERVVWHFGLITNAYSSLIVKLPERRLTFILLANSDRLSAPFELPSGDVTRSVFAALFLKLVT
jgi:CubicO group peptidase (beta-lactamase class C family)